MYKSRRDCISRIISEKDGIIDLPFLGIKNQALDISLLYNAKFSVFSETGLSIIPFVFRKPIVFVNWVLLKSILYV